MKKRNDGKLPYSFNGTANANYLQAHPEEIPLKITLLDDDQARAYAAGRANAQKAYKDELERIQEASDIEKPKMNAKPKEWIGYYHNQIGRRKYNFIDLARDSGRIHHTVLKWHMHCKICHPDKEE